jgi:hypothetical protein
LEQTPRFISSPYGEPDGDDFHVHATMLPNNIGYIGIGAEEIDDIGRQVRRSGL